MGHFELWRVNGPLEDAAFKGFCVLGQCAPLPSYVHVAVADGLV